MEEFLGEQDVSRVVLDDQERSLALEEAQRQVTEGVHFLRGNKRTEAFILGPFTVAKTKI